MSKTVQTKKSKYVLSDAAIKVLREAPSGASAVSVRRATGMKGGPVSRCLAGLVRKGLVKATGKGVERVYSVTAEGGIVAKALR